MARFTRIDVHSAMLATGLVPVFYHPELEVTKNVAQACLRGGARLLEFTNRGDRAFQVFSELARFRDMELPELILGAGSIVDAETAALYINSGADFIVGPNLNPAVAKLCNRRKIAYSPGCATPTEIAQAEELGAEIVKIFPGDVVGGPAFVRALRGPCPWTSLMPTGGVDISRESLSDWFTAGIACAGIGSKLITKELVASEDFLAIETRVRETVKIISEVR